MPDEVEAALEALLARRIGDRSPAAHLTGVAWFAGETWQVPPDVMIPRSPIGEALRGGLSPWLRHEPEAVLDLCCGCGCLGLVAANAFPGAEVDLADIDASALAAARTNLAARSHLAERVRIVQSDLFASLGGRRYDLVICNPPYVASAELAEVPVEFRHEPRLGLDGGDDGLTVWRRIIADLATSPAAKRHPARRGRWRLREVRRRIPAPRCDLAGLAVRRATGGRHLRRLRRQSGRLAKQRALAGSTTRSPSGSGVVSHFDPSRSSGWALKAGDGVHWLPARRFGGRASRPPWRPRGHAALWCSECSARLAARWRAGRPPSEATRHALGKSK